MTKDRDPTLPYQKETFTRKVGRSADITTSVQERIADSLTHKEEEWTIKIKETG